MSARLIGRTGPVSNLEVQLQNVVHVGAAPENEVRVRADGVSRKHARFFQDGDAFWVEDEGSTNGTFVNGERVTKLRLQHLDVVTLGRQVDLIFLHRAVASGQGAAAAADSVHSVSLEIVDGPEAGAVIDVPKGEITLGRAAACNVMVASPLVSKVHAKLIRSGDSVALMDLNSANGTLVNGERVTGRTVLESRDTISLAGARTFTVTIAREQSARTVVRQEGDARSESVFNQDWRTRLVWSAEELAEIEKNRAAVWQQLGGALAAAGVAHPQPPSAPVPPASAGETGIYPAAVKGRAPGLPGALQRAATAAREGPGESGHTTAVPAATPGQGLPPGLARAAAAAAGGAMPPAASEGAPPSPPPAKPTGDVSTVAEGTSGHTAAVPAAVPGRGLPAALARAAAAAAGGTPSADTATARVAEPAHASAGSVPFSSIGPAPTGPITSIRLTGQLGKFQIPVGEFTIGRGQEASIRVDSREISRVHAALCIAPDGVSVEDRNSANGTFVNGTRIMSQTPVAHGDLLSLAAVEFRVTFESEA
jgi:pSer/pThr/pTyr-binding forkhead associated (FHA) protein